MADLQRSNAAKVLAWLRVAAITLPVHYNSSVIANSITMPCARLWALKVIQCHKADLPVTHKSLPRLVTRLDRRLTYLSVLVCASVVCRPTKSEA